MLAPGPGEEGRGLRNGHQTREVREDRPVTRNRNMSDYGNRTKLLVLKRNALASPAAPLAESAKFFFGITF